MIENRPWLTVFGYAIMGGLCGGTLVLAGILRTQFPKVRQAFEAAGMRLVASRAAKEWRSGAFQFC